MFQKFTVVSLLLSAFLGMASFNAPAEARLSKKAKIIGAAVAGTAVGGVVGYKIAKHKHHRHYRR